MNREEFIKEIFSLYPNAQAFKSEYTSQKWIDGYKHVLRGNLNFDKLYNYMITEYNSMNIPPAPAWFNEYRNLVTIHNKVIINQDKEKGCPPPKEFLDLKKKLAQKVKDKSDKLKLKGE